MSTKPRVAIVGGGAIGASIAWRLARAGASVVVVDEPRPGAATPAAAGMLAPLVEAHEGGPFLELGLESLRRWPAFVAALESESGHSVGYARAGRLIAALTAAEEHDLASTYGRDGEETAWPARWLDAAAARALEPSLAPQTHAAVLIRDDHRVDNAALGIALTHAASRAGAELVAGRALGVRTAGGRVTGVDTDGERVDADVVVVCAGAWSGDLDGLPREIPVRPVRGQMLSLRPARALFGHTLSGAEGYLVPRPDGRVIIGSTMEDAGWATATSPEVIAALRAAAIRLVPALGDAMRDAAWAGFRPGTPDGLPILGRDPALDGLVYATGHLRNGILLTPITADAIAALVLGEEDYDLAPWSPERFDAGAAAATGASANTAPSSRPVLDRTCDLCGAEMYEVHCKLICPACGYKRDCSDLW